MKNFFKKLSFVLASAMVITSLYAPANAKAASNFVRVKGSNKAVTSKDLFVGGKKVNFDYTIGKKKTGLTGKWTSSDTSVVTVDAKTGVAKAVANGSATLTFKSKKTKAVKKSYTVKVTVNAFTRAKAVEVAPTSAAVKVGETVDLMATLKAIDKAGSSESTYNVVAMSSDEQVASVAVDGKKITVTGKMASATPATISVFARHKDGDKYDTAKVEVPVTVKAALEAKQVKANKVMVTGANLSASAAAYEVKDARGNVVKFKDPVMVNPEKTEATLEYETAQLPVGKYTLKNSDVTVEFTAEKAMVKEIKLNPEDKAILVPKKEGSNIVNKEAKVFYKLYDQFGEDVTDTYLNSTNIRVTGSDSAQKLTSEKGRINFTSAVNGGFQLKLSKVSVAIVDTNTGNNVSKILTIEEESKVNEIAFKGIWNVATRKFVESIDDDADANELANLRLLFTSKDQYGEPFYDKTVSFDKTANEQVQVSLLGITGLVTTGVNTDNVKIGSDEYLAYGVKSTLNNGDGGLRTGKVDVQAIAMGSGKIASTSFEVANTVKIDTLEISEGKKGLYDREKNELSFNALDQNGKPIKSWKVLKRINYKLIPYGLEFQKDTDGTVKLYANLDKYKMDVPEGLSLPKMVTFTSETNKIVQATLNVQYQRYPVAISSLDPKAVKGITRVENNTFKIGIGQVKFQDQYGGVMSADQVAAYNANNPHNKAMLRASWDHAAAKLARVYYADLTDDNTDNKTDNDPEYDVWEAIDKAAGKFVADRVVVGKTEAGEASDTGKDIGAVHSAEVTLNFKIKPVGANKEVEDDYKFNIYNLSIERLGSFAVDDISLKPAFDLDGDAHMNSFQVGAYGLYAGDKIKLAPGANYEVKNAFDETRTKVYTPKKNTIPEKDSDAMSNVLVTIIKKDVVELVKEYKYSKTPRHVETVKVGDAGAIDISETNAYTWRGTNPIMSQFKVEDQYGKSITAAPILDVADPIIIYSDYDEDAVVIKNNGSRNASIQFKDGKEAAGTVATMKVIYPSALKPFELIVKFK